MIKFIIPLPPISKKNSQRIFVNRATKKPFIMPSEQYKQYERDAMLFMPRGQRIDYPVNIKCLFYMPTRRKCDLTNLLEAIDDILVKAGVIADDNYTVITGHDGSRVYFDKSNPRTEIYIERLKEKKTMKIKLDNGAYMPTRAHDTDAGLDLYATETQIVSAKESTIFDTGVHIAIPEGFVGFLKSKSGLNVKHGITSEGVIDAGYTGSIVVKLYNNSGYDYKVNAGDKISQLVIMPILTPPLEVVESLDDTERGAGGFGSTGK